jgi:L-alanine-DL-glutamate epimerase-like enolase superfamily enzyme
MLQIKYYTHQLKFHHPFTTAHGLKTHQPTLIVELSINGIKGYGEAPAITYYGVTLEQMIEELESKRTLIEKYSLIDPERFWHFLHHLFPKNNFLVCALDCAGWHLFSNLRKKNIYNRWNIEWHNNIITNYTLGIDEIDTMVIKINEKPWPIYKIKLGTDNDLEIIKALRQQTNSVFRIDANAAWTLEKALTIIPQLKELGVELIEQPLAKDAWEEMKILYEKSPLPLIADESCVTEHDVKKCCEVFHGINIKLTKCGGITPAYRMIQEAKKLNKKVMMGNMNECTVGTFAIAQFLPMLDYVDADGPLLHEDIATGISFTADNKIDMQTLQLIA